MSSLAIGIGLGVGFWNNPIADAASTRLIIFDGNSFVVGTGATAGQDLPTIIQTALGAAYSIKNNGVGGTRTWEVTSDYLPNFTIPYVDTFKADVWVVMIEGTNDVNTNGYDGAAAYANTRTYGLTLKATCPFVKTIFTTIVDRIVGSGNDPAFTAGANAYNALMRAQAVQEGTWCDYLVDWASIAGFAPGARNAALYTDNTHPNDLGYQRLRDAIVPIIAYAPVSAAATPRSNGIWTAQPVEAVTAAGFGFACGMAFTVAQARTINALGRRYNVTDLNNSTIKIWASTGSSLLASGTILPTAVRSRFGFRYVDVTPFVLTPGHEYRIAVDIDTVDKSLNEQSEAGKINSNYTIVKACYGDFGTFPVNNTTTGFMYGAPDLIADPSTILTVGTNNTHDVTISFNQLVTLLSTPTAGDFVINGESPTASSQGSPSSITLTFPSVVGAGGASVPWTLNVGTWVANNVAPCSGVTSV